MTVIGRDPLHMFGGLGGGGRGDWWAGLQCAAGPYSNPWQEYTGCKTVQLRAPMPPNPRWEGGGGGGWGCDKEAGGLARAETFVAILWKTFFSQEFEKRSSLRLTPRGAAN